jgi:hypothetical protein
MSKFSSSIKEFINVAGLSAKIRALEGELTLLKQLQSTLGVKTRGRKPGRPAGSGNESPKSKKGKRGKRGKVKGTVLAFLQKHKEGKAIQIAKDTGLKVGSVNQVLFAFKKDGTVTQGKKRGSPFVLAKK